MSRTVHVHAPCRLHFGMFGFGQTDLPQFGGVGVMVDPPAVDVEFTPAESFNIVGSLGERARQFAELAAASWRLPRLPSCQIAVRAPSDHVGLGVGTQLGLAIAAGLRRWLQLPEVSIEALAAAAGRARRSAVGTYGFQQGGLIVDAGSVGWALPSAAQLHTHSTVGGAHPTRLRHRLAIPSEWRFVLVRPNDQRGLAGSIESDAFARLPPVPEHVTRELWRITEEEMLPAVERADGEGFGDAVHRFGRLAGECFSAVQAGPFASAEIASLVEAIRGRGVFGAGQSSWGPTVFALCPSHAEAEILVGWLNEYVRQTRHEITIASPNSVGAVIR
jgi:beta-RFAP synthase